MGDESRSKIDSSLEFDFGLDLKMQVQPTESTTRKRAINTVSPYYYHLSSSAPSNSFSTITNQALGCPTTIYGSYFGGGGGGSSGCAVFPRSGSYSTSAYKGGVVMSEKALFTETQRQELERQKMIYKFIMASIPVPPQLLSFQYSKTSGSDPEPWRCKRTDGKKWRCSRDVAPDQKYCERHAHKTKPRSRKLVETQSHNNYSQSSLLLSPNYTKSQKPLDFTTPLAGQTRCTDWSRRDATTGDATTGDTAISVSTCNQPWHQLMQPSSNNIVNNKNNLSLFQYEVKQGFTNSFLDEPKITYLQGSLDLNAEKTETTRHFFDAWSTGEKDGSSLTLSMSRGIGIGEDMNSVKENDEFLGSGGSWIDSQPGGPLGEVLGLGSAAVGGGGKGASPRHHGYSNSTTSSCCSKSSCDDGSHAHNFIG